MEGGEDKILLDIVEENIRRNREIFEGFNPVTGKGAPGPRVKVKIPDSPIKVQYMPERCGPRRPNPFSVLLTPL